MLLMDSMKHGFIFEMCERWIENNIPESKKTCLFC